MKSVLLIAPEPALVLEVRQALSSVRCPGKATLVREYPTAAQLSNLVRQKSPALVLVSMQDVVRAAAVIEALGQKGPAVVALLSGYDPDQAEAAQRAGAVEFLETPLEATHLEQILNRVTAPKSPGTDFRTLARRALGLSDPQASPRRRRKRRRRGPRETALPNGTPPYAPGPTLMPDPSLAASADAPLSA